MQIWAESGKSALPICNYSQILYQFLTFTQNLKRSRLVPDCSKCPSPCGKTAEYNMQQLWNADEDIRSLKSLILFGIRGMSAYAYLANVLDYEDDEVNRFFCEALFRIGYEESVETLLPTVLKVGEIHLKCMALLDKANTEIC